MKTAFTRMTGIKYPVIGAPMFLVSYEELVIAVTEAGGLGTFPLPNYLGLEELKLALTSIKKATAKPIGVNIQLHGRYPWKEQLAACLDAGVKCYISALGDPRLIVDDVHVNGGVVLACVMSLEQARKAADKGVDGLIAIGSGAGGHGGTISTMVLVPYLAKHTGLPVIASGGIATGEQMAAALSLGACAVEIGTRLIATPEARAKQAYKNAVIKAGPQQIIYTDRITGTYSNWLAESIAEIIDKPDLNQREFWRDIWSAGQSVAQVESIKPAGEVIHEIINDCRNAIIKLQQFL